MHATNPIVDSNAAARMRMQVTAGEPLFLADWDRALFMHYEVSAADLQRFIPLELDVWNGRAFISLVAFTMSHFRLKVGGCFTRWLTLPVSTHEFLNVRTYVRHRGEMGIFFLAEWVPNRVSRALGPVTFGLPYRLGRLRYDHGSEVDGMSGEVTDATTRSRFAYHGVACGFDFDSCTDGSLDAFLLERYTAFTAASRAQRFFRIWHRPWPQVRAQVNVTEASLIDEAWAGLSRATLHSAHFSQGVRDVWMGRPHRMTPSRLGARRLSAFFEMP
ncbi:MAG TPA: DUF2071 domain-containing protein [Verrucomicrobiae bacterium]|nr:DUF2071 domain-containing protein [Verrucomicrobiae bacterium]